MLRKSGECTGAEGVPGHRLHACSRTTPGADGSRNGASRIYISRLARLPRPLTTRCPPRAKSGYISPSHFAYVHTGLGENDRALDWLARAINERACAVYGIKSSFLFTSLHAHSRF
jgi:hypothetical protein